ncbi:MAG: DUF459 domain-containing protein [Actinomycetota bacterium]
MPTSTVPSAPARTRPPGAERGRSGARPTPPRLPQRVYWRRRLAVLLVLVVIGWAAVSAVSGLLGGDDDQADGESVAISGDTVSGETVSGDTATGVDASAALVPPAGDPAPVDGAAAGGDDTIPADAESPDPAVADVVDAATDDEPEETGPPSVSNPATVHIVGDSDAGTFGPYLQTLLDNTLIATTSLDYKVSSGLARPDFFNWPAQLATTIPEVDPDIVVVTFGGNDSQGLSKPQDELDFLVGDPLANEAEWSAEYQRRVLEVLDVLLDDDRSVVWVGIPNDDNPDVTERLRIQDQAVRAAIEQRPEVVFVDTWNRFSGRDGNWAEFVVDPRDGVGKDVRADDGFHLNTTGAEILAIDIAVEVRDLLRERGASI